MDTQYGILPLALGRTTLWTLVNTAAFLVVHVNAQSRGECPALFLRYSPDHSYCKSPDRRCNVLRKSVSKSEVALILKEHNSLRSRVATGKERKLPKAGNMLQMVWDDELASVAQRHAEQCQFRHDCANCRRVQNFGVGQNLMIEYVPVGRKVPGPNWPKVVKSWYDEVAYFSKGSIDPYVASKSGQTYGHFSQVVWADSWRIGCGYVLYKKSKTYEKLYVCNYGPAGNFLPNAVYKAGAPCSACPVNSCCDKTCKGSVEYSGLCKITDNKKPSYKRRGNYLFYCDFQNQRDCQYTSKGQGSWSRYRTLSGNYLGIVLKGGQENTLVFSRTVSPRTSKFCFVISYRKGPARAGQEESHSAKQVMKIVGRDFEVTQQLGGNAKQAFTTHSTTLSWKAKTEVKLVFSVPARKPPQFFEVESAYASEGTCKK